MLITFDNQPTIVVMAFSREQLNVILPSAHTNNYLSYQAALGTAIREQGLNRTHWLQLDADGMPLTGWCAAHPNAAAHAVIARQLVSYLQEALHEWWSRTYPSTVRLLRPSLASWSSFAASDQG